MNGHCSDSEELELEEARGMNCPGSTYPYQGYEGLEKRRVIIFVYFILLAEPKTLNKTKRDPRDSNSSSSASCQ